MRTAALATTGYLFLPTAALSEEAGTIRRLVIDAQDFSGSVTVGEPRRTAQEALDAAYEGARVDNWDGEGSARTEASTYAYARQFLGILPNTLPIPDIAADTDGEILFEWSFGHRRAFSLSVGRDGTLTYAALCGYTKANGTEHLRETLPATISDWLERLVASSGS